MRVLQVFNEYLQRGGEEAWADKVPGLLGEGFEVRDLRFRSSEWTAAGAPSKVRQIRLLGDNPDSRLRLRAAVEGFAPAVLLFHNLIPVASLGLYDEARKLGIPVAQYIHNFRPFSPAGSLWVAGRVNDAALRGNPWPEMLAGAWGGSRLKTAVLAWHLWNLRRSGALDSIGVWIAISEFMRAKFIAGGIAAERIALLPHCWNCRTDDVAGGEEDYYLFLGRLCPEKGVATLLDTWRVLEQRLAARCPRLVVAGEGPLEGRVRDAAGGSGRVEFVGFVGGERKARLLGACRALIAPSEWWEPLGLIVHEAYAHGRPVIAARSGGLAETVRHLESGLLFEAGDRGGLAECVTRMEGVGRDARSAMGACGNRWLRETASPESWRFAFATLLHEVARRGVN